MTEDFDSAPSAGHATRARLYRAQAEDLRLQRDATTLPLIWQKLELAAARFVSLAEVEERLLRPQEPRARHSP